MQKEEKFTKCWMCDGKGVEPYNHGTCEKCNGTGVYTKRFKRVNTPPPPVVINVPCTRKHCGDWNCSCRCNHWNWGPSTKPVVYRDNDSTGGSASGTQVYPWGTITWTSSVGSKSDAINWMVVR